MIRKLCLGLSLVGLICSPFAFAGNGRVVYKQKQQVAQPVRVKEKVVEYGDILRVIGIPVNQVGAEYRWQASQNQIQSCLTDEEINKIAQVVVSLMEQKFAPQPQPLPNGGGQVIPVPLPTPAPVPPTPGPPPVPDVVSKAENLINARCASCHGVNDHGGQFDFVKNGKISMTDIKGKLPPSDVAWLAYDAVFHERMPQNKPGLTDEEVSIIQSYASYLTLQERNAE